MSVIHWLMGRAIAGSGVRSFVSNTGWTSSPVHPAISCSPRPATPGTCPTAGSGRRSARILQVGSETGKTDKSPVRAPCATLPSRLIVCWPPYKMPYKSADKSADKSSDKSSYKSSDKRERKKYAWKGGRSAKLRRACDTRRRAIPRRLYSACAVPSSPASRSLASHSLSTSIAIAD
ncbi:hypothetical protein LMG28138_01554 [Pararobbsia alpina]|uniref:Uncharacterized protein n=1 Tax=Pararobbsia alpina TaxID=621374 RepID=A0A6S7C7Q3_9BURK|nr:hypothetical protein LMG28138_01554 [Pararobbsia alpina]